MSTATTMRFDTLLREVNMTRNEAAALVRSAALAFPHWVVCRTDCMAAYMMGRNAALSFSQARDLISYC